MNTKEQLEAQVKELENKLSEMKATIDWMKEEKKNFKRWRAEKGWKYYKIFSEWFIDKTSEDYMSFDNKRYNLWNYYKTKEEAERARDLQLAIVRVNDAIDEANEWWVADYKKSEFKYIINYCNWFETYIYQDRNFWLIVKECKTIEIAKRIINEFTSELNLIFNIK